MLPFLKGLGMAKNAASERNTEKAAFKGIADSFGDGLKRRLLAEAVEKLSDK